MTARETCCVVWGIHIMGFKRQKLRSQTGTALITVLSLSVALFMFGGVSAYWAINSNKNTQEEFRRRAQSSNIARAGLQDALGWFKQQGAIKGSVSNPAPYPEEMPCADDAFSPAYHEDPKLRATDDPNTGLVKDIILDPGRRLYGRYIIRKQPCKATEGDTDALPADSEYDSLAVHDITKERGKGERGEGIVWKIVSEGIVYERNDTSRNEDGVFISGPDEAPNRVLDRALVGVDINMLSVRKPKAPINIVRPFSGGANPGQSRFNGNCEVRGNGAAAATIYLTGSGAGAPTGNPNCQYEVCPPERGIHSVRNEAALDPHSVEEVFAVSKDELRSVADAVYTNQVDFTASHFDPDLARHNLPIALYYLQGNYEFNSDQPVLGTGILFVDGNLNLQDDAFSFSGLVYVTGTLTMRNNDEISGAAFAGRVNCEPSAKASFEFNEGMLERVRKTLALYRENTLTYVQN